MSPTEYARYMQERQTRCAEAGRRAAADQVAAEERRRAQEEQERVKRQREAQEAAEREAREAQARIARVEADRKYQVAVSEQERITRDRGYKPITFQDFALDGKELAASDAKIAIKGVYIKRGEIEMLFPSMLAAIMAEETFQRDAGVALLTEDAERNASVQRQS